MRARTSISVSPSSRLQVSLGTSRMSLSSSSELSIYLCVYCCTLSFNLWPLRFPAADGEAFSTEPLKNENQDLALGFYYMQNVRTSSTHSDHTPFNFLFSCGVDLCPRELSFPSLPEELPHALGGLRPLPTAPSTQGQHRTGKQVNYLLLLGPFPIFHSCSHSPFSLFVLILISHPSSFLSILLSYNCPLFSHSFFSLPPSSLFLFVVLQVSD